jgi:uncharacterized metal-binding protein
MNEKSSKTVIFSCSGASNCGQLANEISVMLTEEGLGNMSCLAGIGAHDQKMIEGAKSFAKVLAVDGCTVACSKKTLQHAGIAVSKWICVTDYGIKKATDKFEVNSQEYERVLQRSRDMLASR